VPGPTVRAVSSTSLAPAPGRPRAGGGRTATVHPVQGTLDELGTPLRNVTFVVVDLETTGGSADSCGITEIGAVKVRGGAILGEFQTLVNPGEPVPPFIAVLTGITNAMVADAPPIASVLPAFLEFARGAVLVAHNAGFDIGFLKAACARTGARWPGNQVLDTVRLARHVVAPDEVPNHKLATLAVLFRSGTTPNHRALEDARATVDVLHGLLGRVGNLGVTSWEELTSFTSRVSPGQRRKRFLAEPLPSAPGVYLFQDARGGVLYVGTSKDIRSRVRSYFTASETRSRMAQMVALAASVKPVVCATALEAQVRELRLIAEHKPRFNRRSRHPERAPWVKLTVEPFPRLSVVRQVKDDLRDGAAYLGPFGSVEAAEKAITAVHEAFPLRQCTRRIPAQPSPGSSACVLAEMGRCGAPCTGQQTAQQYAEIVRAVRAAFSDDARKVVDTVLAKIAALSTSHRFEDAAVHRDRLLAFLRGASRVQRLAPLASCAELVVARRAVAGGWEVVLVRHGRLAGTTVTPRGADPMPFVEALRSAAEVVTAPALPAPAASAEETEKVLHWLASPGVRLIEVDGAWSCPVNGAAGLHHRVQPQAPPAAD
jgi:DNA polymerase III subunit epsilon